MDSDLRDCFQIKELDPSYKIDPDLRDCFEMDLDLLDCLGREKKYLIAEIYQTACNFRISNYFGRINLWARLFKTNNVIS